MGSCYSKSNVTIQFTELMTECVNNDKQAIEMLKDKKFLKTINYRTDKYETALFFATYNGNRDLIKAIIDNNANLNDFSLFMAILKNDFTLFKFLIKNGVNPYVELPSFEKNYDGNDVFNTLKFEIPLIIMNILKQFKTISRITLYDFAILTFIVSNIITLEYIKDILTLLNEFGIPFQLDVFEILKESQLYISTLRSHSKNKKIESLIEFVIHNQIRPTDKKFETVGCYYRYNDKIINIK
jgi:ankyrin repeat protein